MAQVLRYQYYLEDQQQCNNAMVLTSPEIEANKRQRSRKQGVLYSVWIDMSDVRCVLVSIQTLNYSTSTIGERRTYMRGQTRERSGAKRFLVRTRAINYLVLPPCHRLDDDVGRCVTTTRCPKNGRLVFVRS